MQSSKQYQRLGPPHRRRCWRDLRADRASAQPSTTRGKCLYARPQSAVFTVKSDICLWAGQIRAQQAGLWRAITFQGFGMAQGKWVDSAQDATVLGGRAGCRAWVPLLKSRPHHVPLSLTGAKDPLLWSGTESDPHVSKPSFRVESVKV